MKITWLGHACFEMMDSSGLRIVTDPYDKAMGYPQPPLSAEVVTISHAHHDHNDREWIGGNPIYLDAPGHYDGQRARITAYSSFHDEVQGKKRGNNLIFTFQMDGLRICHLGDLGHVPSERLLERIGRVDVLMVPVGGNYTLDAKGAFDTVSLMRPRIILPMHYKTEVAKLDVAPLAPFLALFEVAKANAAIEKLDILSVDATTLGTAQRLVLLTWGHTL